MSATWTNEPTGSSVLLDWPWNATSGSGLFNVYQSGSIITDATAPVSPSNVLLQRLAAGDRHGGGQFDFYPNSGGGGVSDIFIAHAFKVLPGFEGLSNSTNKLFFCINNEAKGFVALYGLPNSNKVLYWNNQNSGLLDNSHVAGSWGDTPGTRWFTPNVGNGTISLGVWYKLEFYWKKSSGISSRDGIMRMWLNGVLISNYENLNSGSSNCSQYTLTQTWDGTVGPFANDHVYYHDHLYLSTGGTVTPSPSVPTISSFTPTSGPVGTPITIVGTNFDPSPAGNAITLNGISCQTLGAVPTQLNTAVPNNGTSGQIRVTTSAGQALSGTNFTVTTPDPGGGTGGGTGGGAGTTTYTFADEFSGIQGPRWYYKMADGTAMTYSAGSQLWSGSQLYQGIWQGGCHPGTSSAARLDFITPGAGSLHITGRASDADTGGGDGVTFSIKKNGSNLRSPITIANGDSTGTAYDETTSVVANDYISFEVSAGANNVYDSTILNPVIVYTPQTQPAEVITLTSTNLTLTEFTSGFITLTISPTRATVSVITLVSSSAVAFVPATVTIAANTSSIDVPITAGAAGTATVTATLGTSTTSSTITSTLTPVPPDPEDPPVVTVSPTISAYTDFLTIYRLF